MLCKVLNDGQIGKIHSRSVEMLETVGVMVPHEETLARLEARGARVDFNSKLVRMPEEFVMDCISRAGKRYTLHGRDLSKKAEFGQGGRNYNSIAGEALWLDAPGGGRRYANFADVGAAARFADSLGHINIPGAMADPHELPVEWRCVAVAAEMIRNTTKPFTFWFHDRASAKFINELVVALRGSEESARKYPICYPFLEPISPLSFPFDGIDLLYETSKLGMPVPIGPMAQMGVSAPGTVAGTLALENAEILAGICITQVIREGLPVCYGGICHAFDMATTQMIFSGPEQAIFGTAMTQIGKHYGLPVYINVGLTDSKRPDAQAGMEIAATLMAGAAAGADIFGHMGICGVDQATSLEMLVLQDEIISYVESVNRVIDFSDEAFGIGTVREAGPKGSFLETDHTAEHFRSELWFPEILDRNFYDAWKSQGAKSLEDKCAERKKAIIQSAQPEPLPKDIDGELARIVRAASKELSDSKK